MNGKTLMGEVIKFSERRQAQVHRDGNVFVCGICGANVVQYVRIDHFPSCFNCRMWCEVQRDMEAIDGRPGAVT